MNAWQAQFVESPLAQRLGWALLHSLWQATAAAAVLAIALHALRHKSAQWRWNASCAALVGIAMLTVLTACVVPVEPAALTAMPQKNIEPPILPRQEIAETKSGEMAQAAQRDVEKLEVTEPPAAPEPAVSGPTSSSEQRSTPPPDNLFAATARPALPWLVLGWLIGVVVLSAWHLCGWMLLEWTKRRFTQVPPAAIMDIAKHLCARLRFSRSVRMLESAWVTTPIVVGWIWPTILLPVGILGGLTPTQLEVILAHELAHIRRYDYLIGLIQTGIETLLFYHPAVWWVSRRIRNEREYCCDEWALDACPDRQAYAQALACLVEQADRTPNFAPAASGGKLASRIRRVLGLPDEGNGGRGVAPMLVVAAAVVFGGSWWLGKPERSGADGPQAATHDYFFYMRHNEVNGAAETDSLMQVHITADAITEKAVFTLGNLHIGWEPVMVSGGKFYGIHINDFLSIDLASGKGEKVEGQIRTHALADGKLFATVGDVLRVYDLPTRSFKDLAKLDGPRGFGWSNPPLAVSPDGNRVAFFQTVPAKAPAIAFDAFKLHVMDAETGKIEQVGPQVHSMTFMTGGGSMNDGPAFLWLDTKRIILVRDAPGRFGDAIKLRDNADDSSAIVAILDLASGKMEDILTLPRWRRGLGSPFFRGMTKDGSARILLGELGQYRIDIAAKRLEEDDGLRGDYRLSQGRPPERLFFDKKLLAEADRLDDFSIAPDGKRLFWMLRKDYTAELLLHTAVDGKIRSVAKGWFPGSWSSYSQLPFVWARAEDLTPGVAKVPAGWQGWKATAYPAPPLPRDPDPRPNVADLLTYTLSTDKAAYKQHEPVQLTVTLTNKSDRDLSFKPPSGYGRFFGTSMTYPRGSTIVSAFDQLSEVFPKDPVVIKAGQSFRVTKTVEPYDLGKHIVSAELGSIAPQWQGRLKAPDIDFKVEKSADEAVLLKAKYDRSMALCRAEYEKDPATCYIWRIRELGPGIVDTLIADLNASSDVRFRKLMGAALAGIGSPRALPYYEKLLAGDLKDDRDMVLSGLMELIGRQEAVDKALPLLVAAAKHATAEVRRGAVERLKTLRDPKVKAGMEAVLGDPDTQVSLPAARYLAALEELTLADWLKAAAEQPNQARYLAARTIVADLERTWRTEKGRLPGVTWDKAAKDERALDQFRQTLQAWQAWAQQNPRESEHFFDDDRNAWKEP